MMETPDMKLVFRLHLFEFFLLLGSEEGGNFSVRLRQALAGALHRLTMERLHFGTRLLDHRLNLGLLFFR